MCRDEYATSDCLESCSVSRNIRLRKTKAALAKLCSNRQTAHVPCFFFFHILSGHVRTAAVSLRAARPLNCLGLSQPDPDSGSKAEGSFHEHVNVNSSPSHQKPAPRPISEQGARKTDVGKTYCIIPYVTSVQN